MFADSYTGVMSWLRLGSPEWVEGSQRQEVRGGTTGSSSAAEGVSPATLEAVATLMEDLRLIERESWAGLSDGRTSLLPFLEQLGTEMDGWRRGDPFGPLEWAIARERKGEERPAGKVGMVAKRLALPNRSARAPVWRQNIFQKSKRVKTKSTKFG